MGDTDLAAACEKRDGRGVQGDVLHVYKESQ